MYKMFWEEYSEFIPYPNDYELYGAYDEKYLEYVQKIHSIQSKMFKAEPLYDKPGKFIYHPACNELENIVQEIEEYISNNIVPKDTIYRLETLIDEIHLFISAFKNFKYYNDV